MKIRKLFTSITAALTAGSILSFPLNGFSVYDFDSAQNMEYGKTYNGDLNSGNHKDIYKFTVDTMSVVMLSLESDANSMYYHIYKDKQTPAITSMTTLTKNLQTNKCETYQRFILGEGDYYLTVNRDLAFDGSYSFNVKEIALGDVNADGCVHCVDASIVLTAYASKATGNGMGLTTEQIAAADISNDIKITDVKSAATVDAVDASLILSYYAYTATRVTQTVEEFIGLR